MLVKYEWRTIRDTKNNEVVYTFWIGYFLLGFIPIYIEVKEKRWSG